MSSKDFINYINSEIRRFSLLSKTSIKEVKNEDKLSFKELLENLDK